MNLGRWFAVYSSLRFYNMLCEHSSVRNYVLKSQAHKNVKHQYTTPTQTPASVLLVSGMLSSPICTFCLWSTCNK